ncbi:hypothetical protein KY347_00930 [Candidatus Woesearchaeota archaeon]|nr:hypothetical protein [Candidatus Woesearchaeota archaeon]
MKIIKNCIKLAANRNCMLVQRILQIKGVNSTGITKPFLWMRIGLG